MEETPLKWLDRRASGILLHPTSLPGPYGIGTLNDYAYRFIDHLKASKIRYWQVLPLGPTGYGDSPYQAFSAFAGNPYLINCEPLVEHGILHTKDLEPLEGSQENRVDYGGLYQKKWPLLNYAYRQFKEQKRSYIGNYGLFEDFCKKNKAWLENFSGFMALKAHFGGKFWGEWPDNYRSVNRAKKSTLWKELEAEREAHKFYQYLFFGQWNLLKKYANEQGVELIGDIPIFVSLDSTDVWANPELFELGKAGKPDFVAGVPPDYFSETGQLWGNPLYDWAKHKQTDYKWWMKRLRATYELFDVIRLDHFRGFYDYWKIPGDSKDATTGFWANGPQEDLFIKIHESFKENKLIAEDLGEMGPEVKEFRKRLGLPGMSILQFAFCLDNKNEYLPHNVEADCVSYPGSHDNDTTCGWYENSDEAVKDQVRKYLRVSGDDIAWDFIRANYQSVCKLVIIPTQDFLSLGNEARMNAPGTEQGNWQWRMTTKQFHTLSHSEEYLSELASLYDR